MEETIQQQLNELERIKKEYDYISTEHTSSSQKCQSLTEKLYKLHQLEVLIIQQYIILNL